MNYLRFWQKNGTDGFKEKSSWRCAGGETDSEDDRPKAATKADLRLVVLDVSYTTSIAATSQLCLINNHHWLNHIMSLIQPDKLLNRFCFFAKIGVSMAFVETVFKYEVAPEIKHKLLLKKTHSKTHRRGSPPVFACTQNCTPRRGRSGKK